jgi:uncharacterized Zn-finger protein
VDIMAEHGMPHFQNDAGDPVIRVGAREFKCIGATPPFDHPHIYIDMGSDTEAVCSYCSTLYRYDATLGPRESVPASAAYAA